MQIQTWGRMIVNKCALYIPRPGATSTMIQYGYVDTLRLLGWQVYVGDPKTKLGCRKLIEKYGVRLIITSSRYGMRQLPINTINANEVMVIVDALPLNPANDTIDEPYEFAHDDEPDLVKEIQTIVVHTRIEPHLWSKYMSSWQNSGVDITHLPVAGNMARALPLTCSIFTDVAMVANFNHRQNIMRHLIEPMFKRLDLLGYSYQAFGDNIWKLAGLNYNGPLVDDNNKLANIYATARVCPNVHTEAQVGLQACVNERSFMIPLCGGIQVSDNPLISKYLGSHCEVANNVTDFMKKVIALIEDHPQRMEKIRADVEFVANNHTYFNRLSDIFNVVGLYDQATSVQEKGNRAAIRHCWEIDARLSAEERGVSYEQKIGAT